MTLDIRDPQFRKNPYPAFKRLRREAPVCKITTHDHWLVSRHKDVLSILRNPKLFPSSGIAAPTTTGPEFLMQTRGMIDCDPPDHTRLRSLVSQAFTPSRVVSLEPKIRLLSKIFIEACKRKGEFDIVREFFAPLPIVVIAEMLGVEASRKDDFKRWSDILITWRNRPEEAAAIRKDVEEMFLYLSQTIRERKENPKDDLISALVFACEENQKLTPLEVLGFIRLLLVAGNETTTNLLGNTLLALIEHPSEWAKVKNDPSLIPNLVEESLRYDSPAISLTRRVAEDVQIEGVSMKAGDFVLPLLASANHDDLVFKDPEKFDVTRNAKGHLSFGEGIHFCLGAPLARLQARVVFEEVFSSFIGLKLQDGDLKYINSFFFRGLKELPVSL